jgi:hypothetical protein
MKTHIASLTPNAQGVITDTASLLKNYKDFILDFDNLTPMTPSDQCQITFAGALPNLAGPPYAFGFKNVNDDGWAMSQNQGNCGSGVVDGSLTIFDPANAKAPGVVAKGSLICDGVATEVVNLWLVGLPATQFTISYPGGIKSGSVSVYGIK